MKHCVLVSAFCPPTPVAGRVGRECLRLIERYHADSRVFVGLQPGFDPQFEAALREAPFEVEIGRVEERLAVDSDLSGYVTALDLLRRSRERYDVVWFVHTKGASRETFEEYDFIREILEREVWARREDAERVFRENEEVGVIGNHMSLAQFDHQVSDAHRLRQMCDLSPSFVPFTVFQTHPIFRGEVVHRFLERCDESFFTKNLLELHFDRFFFESTFPSICTMLGYEPHAWDFDLRDPLRARIDQRIDLGDTDQGHAMMARELAVWRRGAPYRARAFPLRPASSRPTTASERGRRVERTLRVGVAPFAPTGPVGGATLGRIVAEAAAAGVRVLALPECSKAPERVPWGPSTDRLLGWAKQYGMVIGAGVVAYEGHGVCEPTYVVCLPDGAVQWCRRAVGRREGPRVFDTTFAVRIGVVPEVLPRSRARAAARAGADLLVISSPGPSRRRRGTGSFLLRPGSDGDTSFVVIDPAGDPVPPVPAARESLVVADLDLGRLPRRRNTGARADPTIHRASEARDRFARS